MCNMCHVAKGVNLLFECDVIRLCQGMFGKCFQQEKGNIDI
jgi:hypothetical protein